MPKWVHSIRTANAVNPSYCIVRKMHHKVLEVWPQNFSLGNASCKDLTAAHTKKKTAVESPAARAIPVASVRLCTKGLAPGIKMCNNWNAPAKAFGASCPATLFQQPLVKQRTAYAA